MLQFKFVHFFTVSNFVSKLFFRISYSSTGKYNFDINFFQVLTYFNCSNFGSIAKYCSDNW